MKIYHYDENKIFICESEAKLDPLEKKINNKDIYLVPANATLIKPPDINVNEVAIFENNKWTIYENIIGRKYYLNDGTEKIILDIKTDISILNFLPPPNNFKKPQWDEMNKVWIETYIDPVIPFRDELIAAKNFDELKSVLIKILLGEQ